MLFKNEAGTLIKTLLILLNASENRLAVEYIYLGKMYGDSNMKNKYSKSVSLLIIFAFYVIAYVIAGLSVYLLRNSMVATEWRLFVFTLIATLVIWISSLFYKNTSIYDAYWSLTPMVMIIYVLIINRETINAYHIVLLVAFLLWSIRLTINWAYTFKGLEFEDWRYADFRNNQRPFIFHIINFVGLQFMPTLLVYGGFLSLIALFKHTANAWSLIGSAIILAGFLFQLFSDISMHKHLKQGTKGEVNQKGLWKYSRHPNYFGELLIWIGSYVALVLTAPNLWYLGFGPILIVLLFEFISIPLAEKRQLKRRPSYATYIKETSRMLPLPKFKKREKTKEQEST